MVGEITKYEKSPLLPERHAQGDFFVCDIFDAVPKGDMAPMEHPPTPCELNLINSRRIRPGSGAPESSPLTGIQQPRLSQRVRQSGAPRPRFGKAEPAIAMSKRLMVCEVAGGAAQLGTQFHQFRPADEAAPGSIAQRARTWILAIEFVLHSGCDRRLQCR